MDETTSKRWLVGLDLSDRGHGALAFGGWLDSAMSRTVDPDHFVGVHVLEEAQLQPLLRYHRLEELEREAERLTDRLTDEFGQGLSLRERKIVRGTSAETVLDQMAQDPAVRGLIIGRQAKRGERRVVRLGRVARRLLRLLSAPTIVVPPDLRPSEIGVGPIILATSTEEDSAPAATFAKTLATTLHRPLLVAHVVPAAEYIVGGMVPAGATGELIRELRVGHEHRLRAWMKRHELHGVANRSLDGSVVDRLVELAAEQEAPLLVCGSRGMGPGRRLFTSSVASELAASCRVPVAVVPGGSKAVEQAA